MRTISKIFQSNLVYILILPVLIGCGDKEKVDSLTLMQKRLRGTWSVSSVTLNGLDVTTFYEDLTLDLLSNNTYECENEVDPVWPVSGTYEASLENDLRILTRNDGIEMTVLELTSANLVVQFPWVAASGGRGLDVGGQYEFRFVK